MSIFDPQVYIDQSAFRVFHKDLQRLNYYLKPNIYIYSLFSFVFVFRAWGCYSLKVLTWFCYSFCEI